MRILILLVVAVALSGCASLKSVMVDPATGATQNCEAFGIGWLGAPIAYAMHDDCEKKYKAAGLVPIEEYQKTGGKISAEQQPPSFLKIESVPPGADIYAGPDKDAVNKKIGISPHALAHQKGGRMWGKECYKATKDGYFDSPVECFDPVFGDRVVKLTLAAKQ